MKLVVEGVENIRKIVSVGIDEVEYILQKNQELRVIPDKAWKGWRKSDISWSEEASLIIEKPFPETADEIKQKEDAEYMKTAADKIRKLQKRVEALEAEKENGKIKVE